MSFLNAEWRKLAFFNYEIDPQTVSDLVPAGTELDLWQDRCFVSVVGFMFMNTRLLGVKVPFHVNFEEVNLRFYVRRKAAGEWRRGVVFVKEMVPKRALTFVANTIYKEHYETVPMQHRWDISEKSLQIEYSWQKQNTYQSILIQAENKAIAIEKGSEAEFITEHYWGYAGVSEFKTNEYQVTHPSWMQYPVSKSEVNVDFFLNYGPRFTFLNESRPTSVQLAEGSEITVENKTSLR